MAGDEQRGRVEGEPARCLKPEKMSTASCSIGRLGAVLGGEEVFAEAGTLVFKPRGQWHTFWNAGDTPVRLLEIISPGGLEKLFRKLGEPGGDYDPETLPALAASYGCDVDFERTMPIIERHGLLF